MTGRQREEALGLEALPVHAAADWNSSYFPKGGCEVTSRHPINAQETCLKGCPGTEDFTVVPIVAASNLRGSVSLNVACSLTLGPHVEV